jgi:hypothetical protein
MKIIALIMLVVSQLGYCLENEWDKTQIEKRIHKAGFKIDNYYDLAVLSNSAIRNLVKVASVELKKRKHNEEAQEIEALWKYYDKRLIEIATFQRDIGWFDPISDALALIYELTELKLGYEICHALRLDDLKTINHGLRVAFRPCFYGYEEYYKHMAKDPKYRALIPVLSYWTVVIGCSYATYGIGYVFICSPAGFVIEKVVENKIAPKATTKLYNLACKS